MGLRTRHRLYPVAHWPRRAQMPVPAIVTNSKADGSKSGTLAAPRTPADPASTAALCASSTILTYCPIPSQHQISRFIWDPKGVKVRTNRRLSIRLFRRRLALWASREPLRAPSISVPAPKVVAGRRAIALTVIIVTAKSQQNTRNPSCRHSQRERAGRSSGN